MSLTIKIGIKLIKAHLAKPVLCIKDPGWLEFEFIVYLRRVLNQGSRNQSNTLDGDSEMID